MPDINPVWEDGLPVCTEGKCPQYDGKRCRMVGWRPDRFCEPALKTLAAENRRLRAIESDLTEAAGLLEKKPRELTHYGTMAAVIRKGLEAKADAPESKEK